MKYLLSLKWKDSFRRHPGLQTSYASYFCHASQFCFDFDITHSSIRVVHWGDFTTISSGTELAKPAICELNGTIHSRYVFAGQSTTYGFFWSRWCNVSKITFMFTKPLQFYIILIINFSFCYMLPYL